MANKVGDAELEVHPAAAPGFRSKLESQINGDMVKAGQTGGKKFGGGFSKSFRGIAAGLGATLALSGAVNLLHEVNAEGRESIKVGALSAQVIKSTGGVANVTADGMGNLATAISNKVGVDDEAIQSGENLLATFTNIRNEQGKGNKIFNLATKATVDLGAAMAAASGGQLNLKASATQVGKALNDPIKGISALSKVGVSFTDQQKDQIKTLVKSGDTLKAQKVILRELSKEFGGAAASQATDSDKAAVSIANLKEQIGLGLLPLEDKLARKISSDVVPAVSKFITGMQDGTGAGGEFADTVKTDILPVARNLASEAKLVFGALKPVFDLISSLPPQVLAAGGASAFLGSKLGGLRAPLAANASGFEKLGRGASSLAGGAGLLAVADAANRTNPALAGLEGAVGGAAAGLAVAGPWGAAIGFTVGGLIGIATGGHRAATGLDLAAEAAKQGTPTFSDYASTLNQVSAATTKATKAAIVHDLQQKGLLDTTRELGISDAEVVKGLTGGAAARLRLKNDLADATTKTEFFSDASEASKVATLRNVQALQGLSGGLQKSQLELLQSNLLTAENKRQADRARVALENYGKTHAIGTAELFGYTTVKKQAADLKGILANLFNFAASGEKAHPELNKHGTSLGDALGLDVLAGKGKRHRLHGGPVSAGLSYVVGEREPEVFVPDRPGRIVPRVPAVATQRSGGSTRVDLTGARMTLRVGAREFQAYVEEIADERVGSDRALAGERERAFG